MQYGTQVKYLYNFLITMFMRLYFLRTAFMQFKGSETTVGTFINKILVQWNFVCVA